MKLIEFILWVIHPTDETDTAFHRGANVRYSERAHFYLFVELQIPELTAGIGHSNLIRTVRGLGSVYDSLCMPTLSASVGMSRPSFFSSFFCAVPTAPGSRRCGGAGVFGASARTAA